MRNAWCLVFVLALGCSDRTGGDPINGSGGAAGAGGGGAGGGGGVSAAGGAGGLSCDPRDPGPASGLWVAPDGAPNGTGTPEDPLDLATALSSSSPAGPGSTVLLSGGTYIGRFVAAVSGGPASPLVVRAAPGEHVILDGNSGASSGPVLDVTGDWVELYGLEITDSDTVRTSAQTGSSPTDIARRDGVTITGKNVKVVNCVIHDTSQGISFWTPAENGELSGNIIYNNGWDAPDRGHGHAIYTQNETGTKRIVDNVLFFGFSFGIHAYTEGGSIQGFDIVQNTWFSTGTSVPGDDGHTDGCLVGGLQPVGRVLIHENRSWAASPGGRSLAIGYSDTVPNEDATLTDNHLIGSLKVSSTWSKLELSGNEIYGDVSGLDTTKYPDNTFSSTLPGGGEVLMRENGYDPGRAHLSIQSPQGVPKVAVDLGVIVAEGASYTIHSVYDLFGTPLVSGIYDGGMVDVPMGSVPPPQPVGLDGAIVSSDDPGAKFGVFVITHDPCVAPRE